MNVALKISAGVAIFGGLIGFYHGADKATDMIQKRKDLELSNPLASSIVNTGVKATIFTGVTAAHIGAGAVLSFAWPIALGHHLLTTPPKNPENTEDPKQ